MSEISAELLSRLVIGRKLDGRCTYDPKVKDEIFQACLQPSVSVAKIGMPCGINANLSRHWIGERQRVAGMQLPVVPLNLRVFEMAFVPLQVEAVQTQSVVVQAELLQLPVRRANGLEFDLGKASPAELSSVIWLLNSLPCSSSPVRQRADGVLASPCHRLLNGHQRTVHRGEAVPGPGPVCSRYVRVQQPPAQPGQDPGLGPQRLLASDQAFGAGPLHIAR